MLLLSLRVESSSLLDSSAGFCCPRLKLSIALRGREPAVMQSLPWGSLLFAGVFLSSASRKGAFFLRCGERVGGRMQSGLVGVSDWAQLISVNCSYCWLVIFSSWENLILRLGSWFPPISALALAFLKTYELSSLKWGLCLSSYWQYYELHGDLGESVE